MPESSDINLSEKTSDPIDSRLDKFGCKMVVARGTAMTGKKYAETIALKRAGHTHRITVADAEFHHQIVGTVGCRIGSDIKINEVSVAVLHRSGYSRSGVIRPATSNHYLAGLVGRGKQT